MQRIKEMANVEEGVAAAEPQIRARHTMPQGASGRQSAHNRTSLMMSSLIRQSIAGASMLREPRDERRCARCHNAAHPGRACLATAARPKSVFVKSTSDTRDSWLTVSDASRRATLDPSELSTPDGNYARNLFTAGQLDPTRRPAAIPGVAPSHAAHDDKPAQQVVFVDPAAAKTTRIIEEAEEEEDLPREPGEEEREYRRRKNVDSGYAWVILVLVFVINASSSGTSRAYGLIFEKLAQDGLPRREASMPFNVMGAIENMSGPLCSCLLALTGSWRLTITLGSALIALAHLSAALSPDTQILSMGVACGVGLSFVNISFFQVNNAYFDRYRSIAFGIGKTGSVFGTLLISPTCQYFLTFGTRACYLALFAFLAPNVLFALFLRPLQTAEQDQQNKEQEQEQELEEQKPEAGGALGCELRARSASESAAILAATPPPPPQAETDYKLHCEQQQQQQRLKQQKLSESKMDLISTSGAGLGESSEQLDDCQEKEEDSPWTWLKQVVANPYFHLIWPTLALFCWLNFIIGTTFVDLAKMRQMTEANVAYLVPAWALGQLVGRLALASLVDLKLISNKTFTTICFFAIGLIIMLLNEVRPDTAQGCPQHYRDLVMLGLIFALSMFIALLYILINGLVVDYVEPGLRPLSLGIASLVSSPSLFARSWLLGHFYTTYKNYDAMLTLFTCVSLLAGLVWLLLPPACRLARAALVSRRCCNQAPIVLRNNCGGGHTNLGVDMRPDVMVVVGGVGVEVGEKEEGAKGVQFCPTVPTTARPTSAALCSMSPDHKPQM